jgi:hypothetical protein
MSERQLDADAILDRATPMIHQQAHEIHLLVSRVIRTNELQVWFVAAHVVDMPLVHAEHSEQVGR